MATLPSISSGSTNLGSISTLTTAALALSNLVLVSPQSTKGYQPQVPTSPGSNSPVGLSTAAQPAALVFMYEGEQSLKLSSDITDHYVEDNTAIEDQIALHPERYTTHGFIGELNDVVPDFLSDVTTAVDKLQTIGSYVPQLTEAALIAQADAFFAYQTVQTLKNAAIAAFSGLAWGGSGGGQAVVGANGLTAATAPQNKQQTMFQQLYGYWSKKYLFTIQTPWCVFQNMAIENIDTVQEEGSRVVTDFAITFKRVRFAQSTTASVGGLGSVLSDRLNNQASPENNIGGTSPTPAEPSFADSFVNTLKGF